MLLATLALLTALPAHAKPQRVVSLNLCADQLVLRLADPGNVAAVTWLARDPAVSVVAERARAVPVNHGDVEEIAALRPDLVIAGRFTARAATAMLKRLGYPVLELDVPETVDAVRAQIVLVADALGEAERGAALAAELDRRLAAVPPPAGARPTAAVFRADGFTVGPGSLIDVLLDRAGLDNLSVRMGLGAYTRLPLETLVTGRPDLLIVDRADGTYPALADDLMRHRALRAVFAETRTVVVPPRLWTCGGPQIADAVAILAAAARDADARR
ncbi:MAG: ABC transporter substrate-binding protein [Rhodospirillales bacterium]